MIFQTLFRRIPSGTGLTGWKGGLAAWYPLGSRRIWKAQGWALVVCSPACLSTPGWLSAMEDPVMPFLQNESQLQCLWSTRLHLYEYFMQSVALLSAYALSCTPLSLLFCNWGGFSLKTVWAKHPLRLPTTETCTPNSQLQLNYSGLFSMKQNDTLSERALGLCSVS